MTNFDKLTTSPEALAAVISGPECGYCAFKDKRCAYEECEAGVLAWLESEAA